MATPPDEEFWVAWEPPPYVRARGPSLAAESAHFVVRWGADGPASVRAAVAAPALLQWLEHCWKIFCDPSSLDFFVTPYATPGWSDDGLRRKLNVYIGQSGLHPHPHDASWAHQGTWVEEPVDGVRHVSGNPHAKLHHSFLALHPGAAAAERTVVHELGHVLQMHTGGHVDSPLVGYQWEAHAEYCTHLRDARWAPHVSVFLRTAHLPIDCTNYDGEGEGGGRQYIVWPFYSFLDATFGRGTAHALWHIDHAQRQSGDGSSLDMISNLRRTLLQPRASAAADRGGGAADIDGALPLSSPAAAALPATLAQLFGAFARASLTLDWGCPSRGASQAEALLASADPVDPLRFTPLCRATPPPNAACNGLPQPPTSSPRISATSWWAPDGSRPLKRGGFACLRLLVTHRSSGGGGLGAAEGRVEREVVLTLLACPPTGGTPPHRDRPPCDLLMAVVGFECGERHIATPDLICARVGSGAAVARFVPRAGMSTYLVSICAGPRSDADFEPLKWGTAPTDLPTNNYVLGLCEGCVPYPAGESGGSVECGHRQPATPSLTVPNDGSPLVVPSSIAQWWPQPRLSGGGASSSGRDLRSGNPQEVNTVDLSAPWLRASGRTLATISLAYRYVVGFSTCEGAPGPSFELQLVDCAPSPSLGAQPSWAVRSCPHCMGSDGDGGGGGGGDGGGGVDEGCAECTAADEPMGATAIAADAVHVLYRSPEAACAPSWDVATGGSPTNYSPAVRVTRLACATGPLRGARQSLRLVFRNGRRNLHLTGAEGAPPCDLGLQLEFEPVAEREACTQLC